jgi:hypothetical protein
MIKVAPSISPLKDVKEKNYTNSTIITLSPPLSINMMSSSTITKLEVQSSSLHPSIQRFSERLQHFIKRYNSLLVSDKINLLIVVGSSFSGL